MHDRDRELPEGDEGSWLARAYKVRACSQVACQPLEIRLSTVELSYEAN